jgi:hypothetical protein
MFKKITNFLFLQIFIISLAFVSAEGLFYVSYLVTKSTIFDVLIHPEKSTYPFDNSTDYIKIAVFGGSSSAGYNSVINFTEIIRGELNKTYPLVKFYIKNYAQNGNPFHRRQAEIVKNVIEKYDILLIYAGHNEPLNYVYKGKFSKIERVPEFDSSIVGFFEENSRTYAIIIKTENLILEYINNYRGDANTNGIDEYTQDEYTQFDYITDKIVFPKIEKGKFVKNFENDLIQIALLAKKYKKQVYVSSARSNLEYWPMVSVYSKKLNNEEQSNFIEIYNYGLDHYLKGNYKKAILHLKKTKFIDSKVAVVDYLIGSSFIKMNKIHDGYNFLNASIDNDGYPARSINALDDAIKDTSDKYSSIHYINTKAVFFNAVNSSIPNDILFSDYQHPANLGHVLIAYTFLKKISNHPLLIKYKNNNTDFLIPSKNEYQQVINKYTPFHSLWEFPHNAYMIARWHIGHYNPSHANDFINAAEKNIEKYLYLSKRTNEDMSLYYLLSSIISAKRGNLSKSLNLANDSITQSKTFAENLIFGRSIGNTGSSPVNKDKWIVHLNKHDIYYSEDIKKFVIKTN